MDSSEIDAAILARLNDPTLAGYMPNGVYFDEAPPGSTRFVIVSLITEFDEQGEDGRVYEDALYMVKAVGLSTASPNMKAAAYRIDQLLNDFVLTPTGYTTMACFRESRVRAIEVDDHDATIRWFHRGGRYRVMMST